jgi:hypothetical protein
MHMHMGSLLIFTGQGQIKASRQPRRPTSTAARPDRSSWSTTTHRQPHTSVVQPRDGGGLGPPSIHLLFGWPCWPPWLISRQWSTSTSSPSALLSSSMWCPAGLQLGSLQHAYTRALALFFAETRCAVCLTVLSMATGGNCLEGFCGGLSLQEMFFPRSIISTLLIVSIYLSRSSTSSSSVSLRAGRNTRGLITRSTRLVSSSTRLGSF